MKEKEEPKYVTNSLKRGLRIISLFDENNDTLSLVEISKMLGVNRTVPYRLLYTLQEIGYIKQDALTKRYNLTPKVLELGFSYLNSLQFPQVIQPYLEKLRDKIGASCYLSILDGAEVVYVGAAPVPSLTTINVSLGFRLPAHATANGKLLIAFQTDDFIKDLFINNAMLKQFTDTTFISKEKFISEVKEIRKKGYAVSEKEFHDSVSSISVPVFNRNNEILAAINVVIPVNLVNQKFLIETALPNALEVSENLSFF